MLSGNRVQKKIVFFLGLLSISKLLHVGINDGALAIELDNVRKLLIHSKMRFMIHM